jgi:hypothetical protein
MVLIYAYIIKRMNPESLVGMILLIPKLIQLFQRYRYRRLRGVVIPSGCGKSTLCSSFSSADKHTILLDLEEAVRLSLDNETLIKLDKLKATNQIASYNSLFYYKCKEYVKTQRENYPKKSYVLFSSDRELLKFVGCPTQTLIVISPSNQFFERIIADYDEVKKTVATQSRQNILLEVRKEDLLVYNSFQELDSLLSSTLKIKHNIA